MATIDVPQRVCDRPGCSARLTDRGGRFALAVIPDKSGDMVAMVTPLGEDDDHAGEGVDLCRVCAESLRSWWSAKARRAVEP